MDTAICYINHLGRLKNSPVGKNWLLQLQSAAAYTAKSVYTNMPTAVPYKCQFNSYQVTKTQNWNDIQCYFMQLVTLFGYSVQKTNLPKRVFQKS